MPPWSAAMWPSSEVPAPKGMTGVPVRGADADDRGDLLGERGEDDRVGGVAGVVGHVLAVLLADRRQRSRAARRGGRALGDGGRRVDAVEGGGGGGHGGSLPVCRAIMPDRAGRVTGLDRAGSASYSGGRAGVAQW